MIYMNMYLELQPHCFMFLYIHVHVGTDITEVDEMAKDGVRDFLRFNRDFLEEIIIQEVPQETLERILIRKAALKSSFEDSDGIYYYT